MPFELEANWIQNLKAVLPDAAAEGQTAAKQGNCRALSRRLRAARRRLARYCRELRGFNKLPPADAALAEHFPALDRSAVELLRALQGTMLPAQHPSALPDWYRFLRCALGQPGFAVQQESLLSLIRLFETARPLTNAEHGLTVALLKGAALIAAADALPSGKGTADDTAPGVEGAVGAWLAADGVDGGALDEQTNRLEQRLCADAAGVYARQDERTRAICRWKLARVACKEGRSELALARDCLREASERQVTVAAPILERYERAFPKRGFTRHFFRLQAVAPLALALALSGLLGNPLWALLLWLPCTELCRPVLERLALRKRPADYLPRLELAGRLPEDCLSLIVVSTLLPRTAPGREPDLAELRARLEELLLACPEGPSGVCLLADLPSAAAEVLEEDDALLHRLEEVAQELNRQRGDRLICLVRGRSYSPTGGNWCGWERKRGAIGALVKRIGDPEGDGAFRQVCGNAALLCGVKYLLMLDYDTGLTLDCLSRLVSIAEHPLNRPVIDRERGVVRAGYGILVPGIVPELSSSMRSPFTRALCGAGGISGYGGMGAELYQSLCGRSLFTGKGLLNVEACRLLEDRFPPESVLSHDILEGGLLRAGLAGDIELTDRFPPDAPSYFKRMHRWVRGDFQNAAYAFRRAGNPMGRVTRFQIGDNLRRALLPVAASACLIAGALLRGAPAALLCGAGFLAVAWPSLYPVWRMLAGGALSPLALRFYSGILPRSGECLCRAALRFLLLPREAWTALDGAIRGLWRRYVSHRRMLEWAPAAAAASAPKQPKNPGKGIAASVREAGGWGALLRFYAPHLLFGTLLLLPGGMAGRWMGALFLLAPVLLWACQTASPSGETEAAPIPPEARERLLADLRKMLAYYDDTATESEHWLPPDNLQFAPVYAVAHRTSPTNIGMMLLSYLTARDCEVISTARLFEVAGRVTGTLERMPDFHGNLYNWYDTATLAVLPPGFVSTVDSGNLLCCLTALAEGLRSYQGEPGADPGLPERVAALVERADLRVFYDFRRDLFSVGWDSQQHSLAPSHYDMLMSEARMTSYFAVARRQVPARHWAALSRAMSRKGLHAGLLSWTGTMFEYYMPELLLHCRRGSIGWESLAFCLHCQKGRARQKSRSDPALVPAGLDRLPWGISESGIYAFDGALNYQYSPNGVQKLARKRGMDETYVAAPYASYLALSRDWEGVLRNLDRFERLGARGRYGFCEAVDFTRSRVGGAGYQVVRSYMAHHVGMSIAAIGNALCGNRMQKRFLHSMEMRRAESLLGEKISGGEFVLKDLFRQKRRRLSRPPANEYEYAGKLFPQQPRVHLLSNGEMTAVTTDVGACWLRSRRTDLTRRTGDLLRAPTGTFAFVRIAGDTVPLTYAPAWRADVTYEAADSPGGVLYTAQTAALSAKTEVRLHRNLPCEQRRYTLQNRTDAPEELVLLICAEPSLFPREDDDAHRAFSKLFLQVEQEREKRAVVVTRRMREGRTPNGEYALAFGFLEDAGFDFFSSRFDLFDRPEPNLPADRAFTAPAGEAAPFGAEPCAAFRFRITLEPRESRSFTLFTCAGGSRAEALDSLNELRRTAAEYGGEGIAADSAARPRLESGSLAHRVARMLLPQVLFRKRDSTANLNAIARNSLPLSALWAFGVSGDFPLVLCEIYGEKETERIAAYAASFADLRLSFVEYDLVFLYDGRPAVLRSIQDAVDEICGEGVVGQRAGVHILDKTALSPGQVNLLQAAACHIASRSLIRIEAPARPYLPITIRPVKPAAPAAEPEVEAEGGFFAGTSFFVTGTPRLPWCHILANPTFGTLVSDRALGFTWAVNSRENKLTPWWNDPLRENRSELLLLRSDGFCHDLVNGALAEFSAGGFHAGLSGMPYARWQGTANGIRSSVTAAVPAKGMIKYLDVTLENTADAPREIALSWYVEPCLAVTRDHARHIHLYREEDALLLHNPLNEATRAWAALSVSGGGFALANDRPAFFSGEWEQVPTAARGPLQPVQDPCAALTVHRTLPPKGSVKLTFCMSFAATKRGALALCRRQPCEPFRTANSIRVRSSAPRYDRLVNVWLPWQIAAGRLWGRTGFYQNGGAYGFRDQLQDVSAYLLLSPETARRQILRAAAVQFEEGDVLHWWHPLPASGQSASGGGTKGVRTRYSDDLVWLPDSVARYVAVTGDTSLLAVQVPYLRAPELTPEEHDRYLRAEYGPLRESVYAHCKRALARAHRLGRHALVKIGGGDWNDGYNRVGAQGEGESVWLTQFLAMTLRRFAPLCRQMGEPELAMQYEADADRLLAAVDAAGWDGEWYRRGYYDDGRPMGSRQNDECRIDSLPQSFSVLAGMPDPNRREQAVRSAVERLVDDRAGIIKLFAPSFDRSEQEPGYVKAYPPGIRENGGQYTHAAVWLALAACESGMPEEFAKMTELLDPTRRDAGYGLEPYWMAGDISLTGRGGWSLYTGSAGWYYRLLVEYRLGLRIREGNCRLEPHLPPGEWAEVIRTTPEGRTRLTTDPEPASNG